MKTSAATLLVGPLLAPAAATYGIGPIQFGIIVAVNIEIGLLAPPLQVIRRNGVTPGERPRHRLSRHRGGAADRPPAW